MDEKNSWMLRSPDFLAAASALTLACNSWLFVVNPVFKRCRGVLQPSFKKVLVDVISKSLVGIVSFQDTLFPGFLCFLELWLSVLSKFCGVLAVNV